MLTPNELRICARAKRKGIVNPIIAYQEAKRAGLEFAVLCAVLMKETAGGHNVFGHDGGGAPCAGWGLVTASKYRQYVALFIRARVAQGVGPMQLTYRGFQTLADKAGGCWKVRPNIRVGAEILAKDIKHSSGADYNGKIWNALRAYNGSAAYADSVLQGVKYWRSIV